VEPGQRPGGNDRGNLELIINELSADHAALRIVLQSFVLRLLTVRAETAPAVVAELQDHVSRSIGAIPLSSQDRDGGQRWRELVAASAQRLLGEIADTLHSDEARPN
jgi:hypothetical protein